MTDYKEISRLALELGQILKEKQLKLVTAESCTGGWVAQAITSISGSSDWFECGFVTYSNDAKQEMLGVNSQTIEKFGAVSEQTAREMAEGALRQSHAQVSIAVTGVAGPTGGTSDKPVGLVWFAWAGRDFPSITERQQFAGDREAVRVGAVMHGLKKLLDILKE